MPSKEYRGRLQAKDYHFAIVVSRFNQLITSQLLQGAKDALIQHGVAEEQVSIIWVPGTFELPLIAKELASTGDYHAVICLGAVIKGETDHYDYVSGQGTSGIMNASLQTQIPIIFGVLTTENLEQSLNRVGGKHGNKGYEAALAAIEMADLICQLRS